MATHGRCETEGPGPPVPAGICPSGIEDITAGVQVPQRRPSSGVSEHPKPALQDRPAIMGRPRTGRTRSHFISSRCIDHGR